MVAVFPVREDEAEPALSWRIGDRTFLELAMEKLAAAPTEFHRILVAGKGADRLRGIPCDPRVSFMEADAPGPGPHREEDPLEGVRALVRSVAASCPELRDRSCHILVLDPLRPLIHAHEIHAAVQGFLMLDPGECGRLGVTGVSRVRNHHHPKKVLRVSENGGLTHFSKEGAGIYQRQQLAGDEYYVMDPALAVIGRCGEETDWDPAGWVALPLGDNQVRVTDAEALGLARDLHVRKQGAEQE